MLIDISKIKTENRIRKDFGNIQELADDIKQNGLINPPVVIAEADGTYTLLAGERRLRAMRSLGYQQVEVRTWGSLTDEQKLNIEISENEVRKDFSKSERIEYARRLEKIETLKAKERMLSTQNNNSARAAQENFPGQVNGQVRDAVADKVGIGSGKQYEKEKYISDNREILTPEDFADWDEGRLSTNKAYLKIKEQLQEKENQIAGYEARLKSIDELKVKIRTLQIELANRPEKTIEVKPADYDNLVKLNEENKKVNANLTNDYRKKCEELDNLREQLKLMESKTTQKQFADKLIDDSLFFCSKVNTFIRDVGGLAYLSDKINDLPEKEHKSYLQAVNIVKAWADNIINNINQ